MTTYTVSGYAFVPVKVKFRVGADSPEQAMKLTNKNFKKSSCTNGIVIGSEDYGAVWGFEATEANAE